MTIDVHNHFYPKEYLDELEKHNGVARLERPAGQEDPILDYKGDYNILVPGHRDIEYRVEAMDQVGMKMHILSLTTPGCHVEEKEWGTHLARVTNEAFSQICKRFPNYFRAFAALPLQNPDAAVAELEHSVNNLGLVGATCFSNINGAYLDDPGFEPLYQKAEELGVPLFIHPTTPAYPEALLDYRLVPAIGFLIDTTTTIARMIFAGVFDRYPNLQIIAGHLGGTLPYVQERLDRCWDAFPEIRDNIKQAPSQYLQSNVYYDSVAFDQKNFELARSFAGIDRLLLGSDFPHQIGDMKKCISTIDSLPWSEKEKNTFKYGNAAKLLKIEEYTEATV